MGSRKALVRWISGQDGWKGEVLGGQNVPFKIVFVDGAKQGRPQGVTPVADVAFLCDITGETQPGIRKGVLFARPIRPVSFGWVPVGEPCMGVRRQEWQCTDMPDVSVSSCLAPPPKQEPDNNRLYNEAVRLLKRFETAYLPEVFCTFGWPDEVLLSQDDEKNVRLVWWEIGERHVPLSQLAGLCKCPRPKGVEELYVSWRDACRPWPVEFIEGSLSPLPQKRGNVRVTAGFRFRHFLNVEFKTTVIEAYDEYIAWGFLAGRLPEKERRQIQERLASLVPTPQESAREYVLAHTDQLRLSARELACWQAPGKVLFDILSRRESRGVPESEDGYRPERTYEVTAVYCRMRWYLPPNESCPSEFSDYGGHSRLFPHGTTEESAREMNSYELAERYARYQGKLRDMRTEIPFGSYVAFLEPDEQARWAAEYAQAVTCLVDKTLAEVEALRVQIVAERMR